MLVKAIRNAITAPNGRYIVFNALGQLWKKDLPNGIVQLQLEDEFEQVWAVRPLDIDKRELKIKAEL